MAKIVKPKPERRRVMLLCHYWEERFLRGVAGYAREAGWILDIHWRHVRRTELLPEDWKGHGVITNTMGNAELIRYVKALGVPVVQTQVTDDFPGSPLVMHDEEAIGAVAAAHLLSLGFEHYVFCAESRRLATSKRGVGFSKAILAAGKRVTRIATGDARALARLSAPAAIFAVNDELALTVMTALLRRGCAVPHDFALLGVDDDEVLCGLSAVPLSSVNPGFEARGRVCAELLDRMMRGDREVPLSVTTPLRGVTVRASTETVAIPDARGAAALRYMRENYRRPITLSDVADAVGGSLRGCREAFLSHVGLTLAGELARLRREAALELLKDPKLKLYAVAVECGYSGPQHLSRALSRETGKSPREWRSWFRSGKDSRAGRDFGPSGTRRAVRS